MQKSLLIQWGFKPQLNEVKPPADATDFLEVICPILTGSRPPYQNHKGSTVRKDPISATNHKWEVSHLWKSSLSSELRYYPGANSTGRI